MRIVFGLGLITASIICGMVWVMSMFGLAQPNITSDETLLGFYCTLFGCTFAAFPLAMVCVGIITYVSRRLGC